MHTAMPVGIDDFAEARKKYYLVDKTAFIGKLVQHPAQVTLFTRPRRFGKTMLSILKGRRSIDGFLMGWPCLGMRQPCSCRARAPCYS